MLMCFKIPWKVAHLQLFIIDQKKILGKPVSAKTDEFSENFRTAFDPPSAPFSEKNIAIFSANRLHKH